MVRDKDRRSEPDHQSWRLLNSDRWSEPNTVLLKLRWNKNVWNCTETKTITLVSIWGSSRQNLRRSTHRAVYDSCRTWAVLATCPGELLWCYPDQTLPQPHPWTHHGTVPCRSMTDPSCLRHDQGNYRSCSDTHPCQRCLSQRPPSATSTQIHCRYWQGGTWWKE